MLQIEDLTYRIAGRTLLDGASASIAQGWKVGLVGRNGTGKSTLLRLIQEEIAQGGAGAVKLARGARMGAIAQEVAASDATLLEVVLAADTERALLMAEAETATDPLRIADIHTRLYDIDAHSGEARAGEILAGLGFRAGDETRACREFSGGWRMRAALAGVLFSNPDLLLLDEPTNYLDLEGAAWLETYLRKCRSTVIVVSHDREMLNRSVTHILALEQGKLSVHPGGYDTYLRKRAEQAALAGGLKARQDAERARLQEFVDRFRAKASKARQAQSRVKMIEKMKEIALPIAERTQPFRLENPATLASPILELENADLGYGPGQAVLKAVSLRLDHDDRVVIIGPNGQGKTTLVKSIAARLALLRGQRRAARAIRIGYFSQDQLDELRAGETPLDHVKEIAPELTPAKQRGLAAQMGFGPEKIDTPVEKLSGGEKVRLLLGLTGHQKPHVLILDEPTSHLDIDSREALIHALNEYTGAVLLITHDVYLAQAAADRLWLVHEGRMSPYEGDLDDYRKLVLAADRQSPRRTEAAPAPRRKPDPAAKRALAEAERKIAALQAEIAALDTGLADGARHAEAAQLARLRESAAARLAAAEEEWLLASEAQAVPAA